MKKIIVLALISVFIFGCEYGATNPTTETKQTIQTEQIMAEIDRQIGLPNLVNFQQKKIMKMIFEECDKENLICYAYLKADYSGELKFVGKCIGYGVPFSAQYTNPMKIIDPDQIAGQAYYNGEGTPVTVPQADPNGLYMPTSSSATWLLLIDPETNKPRLAYFEPELVVSPFPLH